MSESREDAIARITAEARAFHLFDREGVPEPGLRALAEETAVLCRRLCAWAQAAAVAGHIDPGLRKQAWQWLGVDAPGGLDALHEAIHGPPGSRWCDED